jgi:hypothetical protein
LDWSFSLSADLNGLIIKGKVMLTRGYFLDYWSALYVLVDGVENEGIRFAGYQFVECEGFSNN